MDKRIQNLIFEMGNDLIDKLNRLANNNREGKIAALDSLDEAFDHYNLTWRDIATVVGQYPDLIEANAIYTAPAPAPAPKPKAPLQDKPWRESSTGTGSVVGVIGGIRCTIFKSKKVAGTYGAVANIDDDNQEWHRDFTSIEEAKIRLQELYGDP